jgi:2-desacetyl-2-hydroxyethyl bacteriochlorophyllide A dehydrogenase
MAVMDVEPQDLPADGVRVRVLRSGICGTDLHARTNPRYPVGAVLGHEIAGEVIAIGDQVTGWEVGDRVALYHGTPCGTCQMCRTDRSYMCLNHLDNALGLGVTRGGMAEEIVVGQGLLHRVPEGLSMDAAAVAEPLSIAVHGVNKADLRGHEPVCVLGAGPIGVMTACVLRGRGHDRVVVVDPNPGRRARAEGIGFVAVELDQLDEVLQRELGQRPDVVFECSGHPSAAGLAVAVVAHSGRIVLQGVTREPVAISQMQVVMKEVLLVGAASCTQAELDEALQLLASGRVDASQLVTAVVPPERAHEMFEALQDPEGTHLKVLIAPHLEES